MLKDNRRFRLLLLACCLLAVLFQCVGFFTKAWIRLNGKAGGVEADVDMGLWSIEVCSEQLETCQSLSFEKLADKIMTSSNSEAEKVVAEYYMTEMLKARSLATVAGLAAIFGQLAAIILCINPKNFFFNIQIRRLACCLAWLTSSVFLLAAVICISEFHAALTMGAEFDKVTKGSGFGTSFPWSVLISGFGLFFSAASSFIVAFLMCFNEQTDRYLTGEEESAEQMAKFEPASTIFG